MSRDRPASVKPGRFTAGRSPPIPKLHKEAWISGAKGAYCRGAWLGAATYRATPSF